MGLKEYRQKRNFRKTREPSGKKNLSGKGELLFVVQEHHARHHHFDFRLEAEGVLKSWAIPKGPSLDPSEKRLAIQVEDHPFEYRTFEGTIPKGHYGAGTVKIWDHGTYRAEGASNAKESELLVLKGLREGHLNIILDGSRLKGSFSLVRLHNDQNNQWLLIKKKEEISQNSSSTKRSKSSSSHSQTESHSTEKLPGSRAPMPTHVKPMLATLVDQPFDSKDWIFEIKWDGYRALAEIKNHRVQLYSRNFQSFNHRFPPLIDDLGLIEEEALLDGEVVVLDEHGKPSFQLVQNYQKSRKGILIYYVFDLLYLNGHDIRQLPLIQRKNLLQALLPDTPHLCFCDHIKEKGMDFFKAAVHEGLEGIIAKRIQSPYQEKRSRDWLKIKAQRRQEAIICGFTSPKGSRERFGSLVLGVYENQKLVYVGHTGSGFDHKKLNRVYQRLKPLIRSSCPFSSQPKLKSRVTWVKPEVVCEMKFAEWTNQGIMRQAIFIDIREDKKTSEVIAEHSLSTQKFVEKSMSDSREIAGKIPAKKAKFSSFPLKLTNLDKVFWPDEGYTKGDLLDYYRQVASFILPYLKDRPETLRRYPDGIKGSSFYQKNVEKAPDWVKRETIQHEKMGKTSYLCIQDERSLLYAANLGCIDFNPFNSRIQSLYHPDYLIIDLDPVEVPFEGVIEVAKAVHALLNEWKIPSFCKTSGATGMHIYIPMAALYSFKEVRQFAKLIAYVIHRRLPDLTSLERNPAKRQKKIYLDYLQNNFAQTVVAPYSIRPIPGAPVSTPLKWTEVKSGLNPLEYNINTIHKRLKKMGDIFKPVLGEGIDLKSIIEKIKV